MLSSFLFITFAHPGLVFDVEKVTGDLLESSCPCILDSKLAFSACWDYEQMYAVVYPRANGTWAGRMELVDVFRMDCLDSSPSHFTSWQWFLDGNASDELSREADKESISLSCLGVWFLNQLAWALYHEGSRKDEREGLEDKLNL